MNHVWLYVCWQMHLIIHGVAGVFSCSWMTWLCKSAFQVTSPGCDSMLLHPYIFQLRLLEVTRLQHLRPHIHLLIGLRYQLLYQALHRRQSRQTLVLHRLVVLLVHSGRSMAGECEVKQRHVELLTTMRRWSTMCRSVNIWSFKSILCWNLCVPVIVEEQLWLTG